LVTLLVEALSASIKFLLLIGIVTSSCLLLAAFQLLKSYRTYLLT